MYKMLGPESYLVFNLVTYPLSKVAVLAYTKDLYCTSIVSFDGSYDLDGIRVNESDFFVLSPTRQITVLPVADIIIEKDIAMNISVQESLDEASEGARYNAVRYFQADRKNCRQIVFTEKNPLHLPQVDVLNPSKEREGDPRVMEYMLAEKVKKTGIALEISNIGNYFKR